MTRSLFVLALLTACSSSSSNNTHTGVDAAGSGSGSGSDHLACTYPTTDTGTRCGEIENAKAQQVSDFRAECTSVSGTVSDKCPTTDLVGCCANVIPNFGTQVGCNYTDTGVDPTEDATNCTDHGGTYSTSP